jgi:hypothetical protein
MQTLAYTALERVRIARPCDRLQLIESHAHGRLVFDLGALDETAYASKQDNDRWLHARLCAVASQVVGIDNSALVPPEGLETAPNGRIINADIFALSDVVASHGTPDLIVAGELIEHLPDTLAFLRSLKGCQDLRGVEFVFSTPNACSWHNTLIGLAGRESTHPDHLQIYSYKTLRTLFARADIALEELAPYGVRFDEMIQSSRGLARLAVRAFQSGTNLLEKAAPMLSAGWIGVARL